MEKHHATILIVVGIVIALLVTTISFDVGVDESGYVVDEQPSTDAIACCTIGEKTCYALDDSCDACDTLCG